MWMSEIFDISELKPFQDVKHEPKLLSGGRPAAVLIHGFPGTPAEMGPLANLLNQQGWTTKNILLPGFGPQFNTLFSRGYQEWIEAAKAALIEFQQDHGPILLIGYSMGGSVALNVAAETRPAGLILLAPFWRMASVRQKLSWQVFKRVTRSFRPFRRVSFEDPKIRDGFGKFLPDLDLDSHETQQALRKLRVPNRIMDQVERLGHRAGKIAPMITIPLLIIQGTDDNRVPRASTRHLIKSLTGPFRYEEINAGQNLVSDESRTWLELSRSVLSFAGNLEHAHEQ
jgi:carboxylesterase